jgi:hypothetical protein
VADEVVAPLEQLGDEPGVRLEVDPLHRRLPRKARPLHDDELETVRERLLPSPRRGASDDAAVHEDETLHGAILATVTKCARFRTRNGKSLLQTR